MRNLKEILVTCKKWDIQYLEFTAGLIIDDDFSFEPHTEEMERMSFLIHNYFPPPKEPFVMNLASNDSDIAAKSIELCKNAIDLCKNIGSPFYSVHAGFAINPEPNMLGRNMSQVERFSSDEAREIFFVNVKKLLQYSVEKGIYLLLENNVVTPFNAPDGKCDWLLLVEADEILSFISDFEGLAPGLLLDVGHLKVTARTLGFDPLQFMDKIKDVVKALHLSDNDGEGDTNRPIGNDAWFLPYIADFADLPMVIESYNLTKNQLNICLDIVIGHLVESL